MMALLRGDDIVGMAWRVLVWMLAIGALPASAGEATPIDAGDIAISLDGEWLFAIDPLRQGVQHGWNRRPDGWNGKDPLRLDEWDRVATPHDYLSDPRYEWTGVAWYRRSIAVPELTGGQVCRLQFGRVASKCEVWVNGLKSGEHIGGYSPFEIDITRHITPGALNHLAVRVDNSWGIGDIPGPRKGAAPSHQTYVWRNYGGLLRSTQLVISPPVYVVNQRVVTNPGPSGRGVLVTTTATLRNGSDEPREVTVTAYFARKGKDRAAAKPLAEASAMKIALPPRSDATAALTAELPPQSVERWSIDSPQLYRSVVTVLDRDADRVHTHAAQFGIRSVRVANGSLLVNDEPVRLAGANRVEGHPRHGGLEPPELVEQDLGMMKRAHLDFQRLQHYPPSEAMLDWADRNGMLVILEAPCWGLTPPELSDSRYQENFRLQLGEMIQSSWNHASVVAWSIGNEYHAWTPEGVHWTKTFAQEVRRLDNTRPVTYAALGYDISQPAARKEDRGMHWVDFISVNLYSSGKGSGAAIDKIHNLWPEKPILISEYGKRVDQATEDERVRHFREMLTAVRSRDYVIGLSYWSFNDYRSRYPGGDATGHRPWGIVDAEREPRELYRVMQRELSPAVLTMVQRSPLTVRTEARSDFPRAPLRGFKLEAVDHAGAIVATAAVPEILPGRSQELRLGDVVAVGVRLKSPTGFVSAELAVAPAVDTENSSPD